jgi:chromosome segregation ATPase
MAHIDLVALQQRLAQQQPKPAAPVLAELPSRSTRPAPASVLRTTPAPKARPAAASAAAPVGTLRATTTMRAALPLKATNTRAERTEERARVNALRAHIDELNAEMVMARAEADRALAEERQRADRLNEQVEALSAEVVRAEKQAEAVVGRAERAEAGRDAERARADALRDQIEALQSRVAMICGLEAKQDRLRGEIAAVQTAQAEAEPEQRQADERRRALGRWARLRQAWRGG